MTDRELLELAAKAAGIVGVWARTHQPYGDAWVEGIDCGAPVYWNPLAEDGDALRLAVNLRMEIDHNHPADQQPWVSARVAPIHMSPSECFEDESRRGSATRRVITRAAAEIGKAML